MLMPNQKECNKKFADYYNLRNPTSLMYKISILYKYDHFSDHLWDNYRIDCGALGLQIWMHIAIQCNIYIGMSKNLTYTLSVGAAADTRCGAMHESEYSRYLLLLYRYGIYSDKCGDP